MLRARAEPAAKVAPQPAPRPRGIVARSGGGVVRRVSSYVTPDTYARLRAEAGETRTISEVIGDAIGSYLDRRRPRGARA